MLWERRIEFLIYILEWSNTNTIGMSYMFFCIFEVSKKKKQTGRLRPLDPDRNEEIIWKGK